MNHGDQRRVERADDHHAAARCDSPDALPALLIGRDAVGESVPFGLCCERDEFAWAVGCVGRATIRVDAGGVLAVAGGQECGGSPHVRECTTLRHNVRQYGGT